LWKLEAFKLGNFGFFRAWKQIEIRQI